LRCCLLLEIGIEISASDFHMESGRIAQAGNHFGEYLCGACSISEIKTSDRESIAILKVRIQRDRGLELVACGRFLIHFQHDLPEKEASLCVCLYVCRVIA